MRGLPTSRRSRSLALRLLALLLLLGAATDPRLPLPDGDLDVVFVVDASASTGEVGRTAALRWVDQALAGRGGDDRAGLVVVGGDAQVGYRPTADPPAGTPPVAVRTDATDLERGVELAAGMLGDGRRRRVVLLTDGRPTTGNLAQGAELLAGRGIGLDIVRIGEAGLADVLVESVTAPAVVRDGEAYEVEVVLRNETATAAEGELVVSVDGEVVDTRRVDLPPGQSTVTVEQVAEGTGLREVDAELRSGASTTARNDRGAAATRIAGAPRVLVAAHDEQDADALAAALAAGGIGVDRVDVGQQGLPGVERLVAYDAVVLVDVPADVLGEAAVADLDAAVRDAGVGLVTVGGDSAYGLGRYGTSALDELLPVSSRITDPLRRPSVAEALVVDSSESMGACHCSDQMPVSMDPGGVNKTEIARQAVRRAIDQLEASDTIGVLAFDTDSRWVVPLQQVPDDSVIDDGLAQLHPSGNTDIPQAIRIAVAGLRETDAELRHIVLFSDGFMGDLSGLVPAAEEVAAQGITLSVVGTGEGSFPELEQMAEIAGGRYYAGRNLAEIPDILAAEVVQVSRPLIAEGSFLPTVTAVADATADLDRAPPLLGFVATTAKPTARRLLTIGEHDDPLLATWQAGLGSVASWTSDAGPRWSAGWVPWEGFQDFWATVVRSTFPEALPDTLDARVVVDGGDLRISADLPAGEAGLTVTATATGADGERESTELTRDPEGGYSGSLPATAEGVHLVTVQAEDGQGGTIGHAVMPVVRTYPAEFGAGAADDSALTTAVQRTGGILDPDPETAFRRDGLSPGTSGWRIGPWLALLALLIAVGEVGLRRLRLERGDWRRIAQALGTARVRRPARAARPAAAPRDPASPPPPPGPLPPPTPVDGSEPAPEPAGPPRSPLRSLREARDRAFDDPFAD